MTVFLLTVLPYVGDLHILMAMNNLPCRQKISEISFVLGITKEYLLTMITWSHVLFDSHLVALEKKLQEVLHQPIVCVTM